ncbi:hypothetical protein GQ44DRAFT_619175 [Phaeosphaeriaceae sp. PMI808]|nr:hypothetical protein GQ44DRAFT_619175 [Phaeosphaeriaceae sp. PMI808]
MSCARSWEGGDGEFLLVISGPTRNAPYLADWQGFKDNIRKVVKEQPGWVDVHANQGGQILRRGDRQGWARLKEKEDADAAYSFYSKSKGVLVHVWETCRSNEGFRRRSCNCSSLFPEIPEGAHSEGRCGIDIGRVGHLTGIRGAQQYVPAPQYMPVQQPFYGYSYPAAQAYCVPAIYPGYAAPTQMPVYFPNTHGMPVNVGPGAVVTEARGIFVQNLNFKCTLSDFYSLLLTVAQPVDHSFTLDSRTGAFKGAATANFRTKEDAQYAVRRLDGIVHMGMPLKVRLDKEATPVGLTSPLIVSSEMYKPRCK